MNKLENGGKRLALRKVENRKVDERHRSRRWRLRINMKNREKKQQKNG